jgi:hypothetical protein
MNMDIKIHKTLSVEFEDMDFKDFAVRRIIVHTKDNDKIEIDLFAADFEQLAMKYNGREKYDY